MRNLVTYESWLNEENLEKTKVFKQKQTTDTYLDMRDYWRSVLGEDDEDNQKLKRQMFGGAKTYSVDISKIVPNQDYLKPETIQQYVNQGMGRLPQGVKFKNGLVVVFDGHHRIAAQILKGEKTIPMQILKANF
jgi:hypothetical protein